MARRPALASLPVSRLPFLEALRGIAALYVVLGHICTLADPAPLLGRVDRAPQWLQTLMQPFAYGHLAVAAFIVISGFCLQLSLFSRADGKLTRLSSFYKRRALRILPAYYACLAFSVVVCLAVTSRFPELDRFLPVNSETVLTHVFLVHNFSEAWMYKINGVLWSIAIEAQLYLIFPLLVISFQRFGRWRTLGAASAFSLAEYALVPRAPKLYPWYLALFVFGMVSAHLAYRPALKFGTRPSTGWLCAGIGFLAAVCAANFGDSLLLGDAAIGFAVAALAYALTTSEQGWAMSAISQPKLVALGAFSYSLYLMHHPILQVVYGLKPGWAGGEVGSLFYLLLVGLPVVLVGTWAFSLAFERPFMPRRPIQRHEIKAGMVPLRLPLRTYHGSRHTLRLSNGEGSDAAVRETAGETAVV